jgi:hypothetical protein
MFTRVRSGECSSRGERRQRILPAYVSVLYTSSFAGDISAFLCRRNRQRCTFSRLGSE